MRDIKSVIEKFEKDSIKITKDAEPTVRFLNEMISFIPLKNRAAPVKTDSQLINEIHKNITKEANNYYNYDLGCFYIPKHGIAINFITKRKTTSLKVLFEIFYSVMNEKGCVIKNKRVVLLDRPTIINRLNKGRVSSEKVDNHKLKTKVSDLRKKFKGYEDYINISTLNNKENGYYFEIMIG